MNTLTEQEAERLIAGRAFACTPPGFVGAAVDLPLAGPEQPPAVPDPSLAGPGLPPAGLGFADLSSGPLHGRAMLRHGFLAARSPWMVVVSGPPSPGLGICLARMAEDLPLSLDLLAHLGQTVLGEAAPIRAGSPTELNSRLRAPEPTRIHADPHAGPDSGLRAAEPAGIRVCLEAGLDGGGLLGLPRRWALAHAIAPVLAAAFANSPLDRGRPSGWRSLRQAARLVPPALAAGADPRASWTAYVMDAPVRGGRTFRERTRSANPPTVADLDLHLAALRPPVAARGHLELDFVDRQPGAGWRVAVAVTTTLLDDPLAAAAAEAATEHFAYAKGIWQRAARDALTDPQLAAAARECFLAAYAALARQGAARSLRDAVADFTERYVLRGRCPADDQLARATAAP